MLTILKKELWVYFGNYTVYAVMAGFTVVSALFLWFFDNEYNVFNLSKASLDSFFFLAPWILLFIIPALTMRQFAEEKQLGTLDWLFTQPIKLIHLVVGKFASIKIIIALMLTLTFVFVYSIYHFSLNHIYDLGSIISGYIGLYLLALLFASIGLMTSALFSNQVMAYLFAVFLNFILFYGLQGLASYNLLGGLDYSLQQIGANFHYNAFLKGIIDTRDLFYFIGSTLIFLLFTYVSLLNFQK